VSEGTPAPAPGSRQWALQHSTPVSGVELLLLVCAGLLAGLAGSIAGLASLASYPALLAVGLGPVTANVTNTVALVFVSVGATLGSQAELRGQAARVRGLAIAALLGGSVGAGLLLLTPSDTFERIAPWLIGASSLTILIRPRLRPSEARHDAGPALIGGVFAIAIYGGYFGAGAGVMLLALMLAGTRDTLARSNALKNAVLGIANAVAALAFCVLGPVHWAAVAPLALGLLAGGRLGPIVVRHANATLLRALIGLAGLVLAVKLGADAYG
jgi:uncharacterized membrane protein YfcA